MSAKKRALGRGLDSLITPVQKVPEAVGNDGRRVLELKISSIRPNTNQPRSVFDDEHLDELADSIREKGVLQPLLVRKAAEDGRFELIAGERRLRASKKAGLEKVPALVVKVSDEASFEIALIENLQREDLNPMEEARAYESLMEQFDLAQEDVARRVGKGRSTVANSLRLLKLPQDVQEDLLDERLSAGHARAILALSDAPRQRRLRNRILEKKLSVRQAEQEARRMLAEAESRKGDKPKRRSRDPQLLQLQEALSMRLGLAVSIKPRSASKGSVEIRYESLDDFEAITEHFGVET